MYKETPAEAFVFLYFLMETFLKMSTVFQQFFFRKVKFCCAFLETAFLHKKASPQKKKAEVGGLQKWQRFFECHPTRSFQQNSGILDGVGLQEFK